MYIYLQALLLHIILKETVKNLWDMSVVTRGNHCVLITPYGIYVELREIPL